MGQAFADKAHQEISVAVHHPQWSQHIQIAAPQLRLTQRFFPQYIEELKGYAAGAGVAFSDLWTISLEDDAFTPPEPRPAKCTTIITNNGRLIGHSEDHDAEGQIDLCIVKKTIGTFSTTELFYYDTIGGSAIGFNSAGYVHAVNTLLYTRTRLGVPKLIQARALLDSTNPAQDLQKVAALPRTSGFSHLLVAPSGELWHAEFTAITAQITTPAMPFCHTNHCTIGRTRLPARDIWGTSSRLTFARKAVKPQMTDRALQQLLLDDSLGDDLSLHNERSMAKMVINLETHQAYIWLRREEEKGWVIYPMR